MKKENDPVPSGSPVNMDALLDKLAGDQNQLSYFLELFKAGVPELLDILKDSLKNKDVNNLVNACHGLRGMLLVMEMKQASSIAIQLEESASEKNFDGADELFHSLEKEIKGAVSSIEKSIDPKNKI
ncbi:MAG TPA: Hpt domain-containing protein [Chitinophagaceae bacterium]|nr:Hpt domain-containing protein [Chitinophagaceae bacterium]